MYTFNFAPVWQNLPYLIAGSKTTLIVTFASVAAGLMLGLLVGTLRLQDGQHPPGTPP